jgi:hypothetical protein
MARASYHYLVDEISGTSVGSAFLMAINSVFQSVIEKF